MLPYLHECYSCHKKATTIVVLGCMDMHVVDYYYCQDCTNKLQEAFDGHHLMCTTCFSMTGPDGLASHKINDIEGMITEYLQEGGFARDAV